MDDRITIGQIVDAFYGALADLRDAHENGEWVEVPQNDNPGWELRSGPFWLTVDATQGGSHVGPGWNHVAGLVAEESRFDRTGWVHDLEDAKRLAVEDADDVLLHTLADLLGLET